ncbi:hypothetical protein HK101_001752 [Irineochytrium annulatum]|nr:hypothetical protein HK101_001752 [Irineochytrium annulatum]
MGLFTPLSLVSKDASSPSNNTTTPSIYNLTLGGAQYDSNNCPIYPPGYVPDSNPLGWSDVAAWVFGVVYAIAFAVIAYHLFSCFSVKFTDALHPKTRRLARTVYGWMTFYGLVRVLGFLAKGYYIDVAKGSTGWLITALVLQGTGFLPLIHVVLDVTSDWVLKLIGTLPGIPGLIQRRLNLLVTLTVVFVAYGATSVASAAPCMPSSSATNIRNISLWLVAGLSWIAIAYSGLLLMRETKGTFVILMLQSIMMVIKTTYNLLYNLQNDLHGDTAFYLVSILPEVLFTLPLLLGPRFVVNNYLWQEQEDDTEKGVTMEPTPPAYENSTSNNVQYV